MFFVCPKRMHKLGTNGDVESRDNRSLDNPGHLDRWPVRNQDRIMEYRLNLHRHALPTVMYNTCSSNANLHLCTCSVAVNVM